MNCHAMCLLICFVSFSLVDKLHQKDCLFVTLPIIFSDTDICDKIIVANRLIFIDLSVDLCSVCSF